MALFGFLPAFILSSLTGAAIAFVLLKVFLRNSYLEGKPFGTAFFLNHSASSVFFVSLPKIQTTKAPISTEMVNIVKIVVIDDFSATI